MIAQVPWSPLWQGLLDGMGWALAKVYDLVPNYGLSIILLTVLIRVILLPLGVKQIRSMQQMQAIQPKVKAIQQKYKGNRQKQQEETMKLYQEHGVNPFSGCWPVLLQFPVLIAMYSVLRYPQHPPHVPARSELRVNIEQQLQSGKAQGTDFLGTNLLCSALQAGRGTTELKDPKTGQILARFDCGNDVPIRIPYYIFAVLMFGTTYYQQRQMQKASPPGSQSQQQQAMMRVMPLMFGVWGFFFPAGLVVYWTTSNLWQIGQQTFMLRAGHIGPGAADARARPKKPARRGFMASLMERAERERSRRDGTVRKPPPRPKPGPKQSKEPGGEPPRPPKKPGSGGSGAGGRKKRPKR